MNDQEFREKIIEGLTRLETKVDNILKDMAGHHRTLYGQNGKTGICSEVDSLRHSQGIWNRSLAVLQLLIIAVLTYLGFKFKGGG